MGTKLVPLLQFLDDEIEGYQFSQCFYDHGFFEATVLQDSIMHAIIPSVSLFAENRRIPDRKNSRMGVSLSLGEIISVSVYMIDDTFRENIARLCKNMCYIEIRENALYYIQAC